MNRMKFFLRTIFGTVVSTVIAGSVLQTFMLEKNISEDSVGLYFSIMQAVQILTMLLLSKQADKMKNIIGPSGVVYLLFAPFILVLTGLCFFDFGGVLLLIMVFGLVANFSLGLSNILTYKLPYHIMDMKYYGSWTGVAGVLSGVMTLLFSVLLTFLQKKFEYITTMRYIYIATLVATCLAAAVTFSFKKVENNIKISGDNEKISLLKYKRFLWLIAPNLMRGFCSGMIAMTVTIGYFSDLLDNFSASVLLIVAQIAVIVGCLLFTCFAGREKIMLLIGSAGVLVLLPCMVMKDTTMFLLMYGIVFVLITIIDNAVPVAVVRLIDYEVAGQYNGGRMLLHTVGTFFASLLCGTLLKTIGPTATLAVAGISQFVSGVWYFWYLRKNKI
ncbi:MAG: MFS transporter [Clostridia bacterium]|nr:MFS transporter [Clostridia bacterium]